MRAFFLFTLLAVAISGFSQRNLTGLWSGSLTHDSLVGRKDLSFELALTQYKQKVYGYTRRTFIVNDTLYYVLKRVKGKIDGNVCEITDDEYISYNFQAKVDKNVKVTYTFHYSESDSSWNMTGNWKTNKVKNNYRAMSGSISVQQEKDLDNAKIFAHLEELKLADDVVFYQESKKPSVVNAPPSKALVTNNKSVNNQQTKSELAKNNNPTTKTSGNTVTSNTKPSQSNTVPVTAVNKPGDNPTTKKTVSNEPGPAEALAVNKKEIKSEPAPVTSANKQTDPTAVAVTGDESNQPKPKSLADTKVDASMTVADLGNKNPASAIPPKEIKLPVAAAFVAERKAAPPQIIDFKTDSIELSLYDNGEVDGDTVSVLLNDAVIIAKQGLRASAFKKTIYFPQGSDEFKMVLYAENLGKYPPNTGLLIIHDGEDVHQVRFSADLQQNAVLIFRRKK